MWHDYCYLGAFFFNRIFMGMTPLVASAFYAVLFYYVPDFGVCPEKKLTKRGKRGKSDDNKHVPGTRYMIQRRQKCKKSQ